MSAIAIDATVLSRGHTGFGRYVSQLVRHTPDLLPNHDVCVFVQRGTQDTIPELVGNNVHTIAIPRVPTPVIHQTYIPRLLRKHSIELCHFPTNVGSIVGSKRAVVTIHDTRQLHRRTRRPGATIVDRALQRYVNAVVIPAAKRARAVITDDEETKRELVTLWGLPEDGVHVILLGVDRNVFHPIDLDTVTETLARVHSLAPGYLLSLGSLDPNKNTRMVLEAHSRLSEESRAEHPLVVVWASESWRSQAEQLIRDAVGEDSGVVSLFAPSDADLAFLYNGALAFVSATLYRGAYLPPLEAMACRAPVILSASSYVEMFAGSILDVDPRSASEVSESLETVVNDGARRKALIARSDALASSYTVEKMVSRTAGVYLEALKW